MLPLVCKLGFCFRTRKGVLFGWPQDHNQHSLRFAWCGEGLYAFSYTLESLDYGIIKPKHETCLHRIIINPSRRRRDDGQSPRARTCWTLVDLTRFCLAQNWFRRRRIFLHELKQGARRRGRSANKDESNESSSSSSIIHHQSSINLKHSPSSGNKFEWPNRIHFLWIRFHVFEFENDNLFFLHRFSWISRKNYQNFKQLRVNFSQVHVRTVILNSDFNSKT